MRALFVTPTLRASDDGLIPHIAGGDRRPMEVLYSCSQHGLLTRLSAPLSKTSHALTMQTRSERRYSGDNSDDKLGTNGFPGGIDAK